MMGPISSLVPRCDRDSERGKAVGLHMDVHCWHRMPRKEQLQLSAGMIGCCP